MYKVAFDRDAEKEFLKLDAKAQKLIASKIIDLKNGNFSNDKHLQGKHKGRFKKKLEIIGLYI